MKLSRSVIAMLVVIVIIIMLFFTYWHLRNQFTVNILNDNLVADGIKFGMTEDAVVQRWGPGEYISGLGGHGREYKSKGISVSFPGDPDNDLYGKVGQLKFSNPEFSIFTVKVGDDRGVAISKLISKRFKSGEYSDDIFIRGEFTIALRGKVLLTHHNVHGMTA